MDYEKLTDGKLTFDDLDELDIQAFREKRSSFKVYLNNSKLIELMDDEQRSDVLMTLMDFHRDYVGNPDGINQLMEREHGKLAEAYLEFALDQGEKDFEKYVNRCLNNKRNADIGWLRAKRAKTQRSMRTHANASERMQTHADIDIDKTRNEIEIDMDMGDYPDNMNDHVPELKEIQDYASAMQIPLPNAGEFRMGLIDKTIPTPHGWKKALEEFARG